ncbi:MAG: hypothetical protein HY049_17340 [Acidobacteria bacterium]|nr:hypothetical protein [Acidobacteriota bacterium]
MISGSHRLALSVAALALAAATADPSSFRPAPEFPTSSPEAWINASPLRMSDLRGKVVLLDVWTFG